jgi:hypothetical protein
MNFMTSFFIHVLIFLFRKLFCRAQIRTLNSFGFSIQQPWQIPLVQAVGATQALPKLKNFFRPRDAASNAIHNSSNSRGINGYTQHHR